MYELKRTPLWKIYKPCALSNVPLSGKYDKGRFFVGIGAEIGLLLNSSTKVKNNVNNTARHTKIKDDFGLNQLID